MTTQTKNTNSRTSRPTHNICKRVGSGKNAEFETIGVAWQREDGGLYVKLVGTQVIESGFYAFPNKSENKATEDGQ